MSRIVQRKHSRRGSEPLQPRAGARLTGSLMKRFAGGSEKSSPVQVRHVKVPDYLWARLVAEAGRRSAVSGESVHLQDVLCELLAKLPPVGRKS